MFDRYLHIYYLYFLKSIWIVKQEFRKNMYLKAKFYINLKFVTIFLNM